MTTCSGYLYFFLLNKHKYHPQKFKYAENLKPYQTPEALQRGADSLEIIRLTYNIADFHVSGYMKVNYHPSC